MNRGLVRVSIVLLTAALVAIPAFAAQASDPERLTKTPKLPDDAHPIELAPGFSLLYWDLRGPDRYGSYSLTGEGLWTGEGSIDAPALNAVLKDADGNVLGSETVFPFQFVAEPGKRIAYDYDLYGIDESSLEEVETVEWLACQDFGGSYFASAFTADLSIAKTSVREASAERLELVVDVRNEGVDPVGQSAAGVLLYDSDRHLLQTESSSVGADVSPGKFGRVTIDLTPRDPNYSYRVVPLQAAGANVAFC